jgi:hypothetical protein
LVLLAGSWDIILLMEHGTTWNIRNKMAGNCPRQMPKNKNPQAVCETTRPRTTHKQAKQKATLLLDAPFFIAGTN